MSTADTIEFIKRINCIIQRKNSTVFQSVITAENKEERLYSVIAGWNQGTSPHFVSGKRWLVHF